MLREFISRLLYRISQITALFASIWPILLVFGLGSSDFMSFCHSMVVLLVLSLVISFVSFFLSMML